MMSRADKMVCLLAGFFLAIVLGCADSDGQFVGSSQKAQVPTVANLTSGLSNYSNSCAGCHSADGSGTAQGNALVNCESCRAGFDDLARRIHATMPEGDPTLCEDTQSNSCARDTAAHILCSFNPELAEGCDEAISLAVVPPEADRVAGETSYQQNCFFCHGPTGTGNPPFGTDLTNCQVCDGGFDALESKILHTMPPGAPTNCSGECALDTAAHVLCAFNPDLVDAESCEIIIPKAVIPATADLSAGATSYAALCSQCHFPDGSFRLSGPSCLSCQGAFNVLSGRIHISMPPAVAGGPALCSVGNGCAENVAAYVFCSFNPERAEGCPNP